MSALLWRSSRRYLLRHPWQLGLSALGIALGVAVVIGVDLATASARVAFRLSTEAVGGRATHRVIGGPAGVPDSLYTALRVRAGISDVAPVVEGYVRIERRGFRLLGLDPFAEAPFRNYVDALAGSAVDFATLLTTPGAVLLSAGAAAELALTPGDSIRLTVGGTPRAAVLAGVLDPADEASRRALADVLIADIAAAQELLGRSGLDHIDVRAPDDERGRTLLRQLESALPSGFRVVAASDRAEATGAMTRAFEINLAALALLALVFGVFLVYNSMTFSVVQRRPLIALLRAQGVTRREIFTVIATEALALGVVSTMAGVALGVLLGSGLVRLVARTINDLYFTLSVTGVTLAPLALLKGVALGVAATVLASLPPAREATATVPRAVLARSSLEERVRTSARPAALAGTALLAVGAASFLLPTRSLVLSFGAVFIVMLGGALLAPLATLWLMRAVRPLAARAFGHLGRMAARGVAATLSRTAPAIAALAVAIAAGLGVGIMIASFRGTVEDWLGTTLQADIYISAPGSTANRSETPLRPGFIERVRNEPGVAGISTYRNVVLSLDSRDVRLVAVELFPDHRNAFTFLEGGGAAAWAEFEAGRTLFVSESFAYRWRLQAGDTLHLPTPGGRHSLPAGGVFYDYASEHGVLFVQRSAYDAWFDDPQVSSIAVFAAPGVDTDALVMRLRDLDTEGQEVFVRSDRALRSASLEVFDRTFAITGVLRILALAVAFAGVVSALMALQLERAREIGVLRATGLTSGQVWAVVSAQTGLMGLVAGLLALPLGLLLSWVMVDIVNRRSFGWTMRLDIDALQLAQALALAVLAALLAGLYPAYRMAKASPAMALREE